MCASRQVFFVPSFFRPPHELISDPLIDGIFAWNGGWRMGDGPLTTKEDEPFVRCVSRASPSGFARVGSGFTDSSYDSSGQAVYGRRQSVLLHALWNGAAMGMEQVRHPASPIEWTWRSLTSALDPTAATRQELDLCVNQRTHIH